MGFYGSEPFTTATATYLQTDPDGLGVFHVEVEGKAPNYSYAFRLVRDPNWVGGLKVDVMGWTGPRGEGTSKYTVEGHFPGAFSPEIIVSGSNGQKVIKVSAIPREDADEWVKAKAS